MKNIVFCLVLPLALFSQQIFEIKTLEETINTFGAELNFVQINDSVAFYTSINDDNGYQSSVYFTKNNNGKWLKGKYSKYNSESFNTGDISFSSNRKIVFSICDFENSCDLVILKNDKFSKLESINNKGNKNVQSHLVKHNNQEVLYFVSDREDGFGGMDIWLSIIDENGNFGVPINAGERINTSSDEITPFFSPYENTLYFSSNRKGGLGGFDVYKSNGKLNLWTKATNVKHFNSKDDEMYLSFYSKDKGYFSSNRKGAKYETTEFCCNDIFSFESINIDTIPPLTNWLDFSPISLYFHNDEPDCCTMEDTTQKTYKEAYILYFKLIDEYENQNDSLSGFFDQNLRANYNQFLAVLDKVKNDLENGSKIELQIRGYASPLHKFEYNINLSKRRIKSVINFISVYQNAVLSKHLKSGDLVVTELPLGESKVSEKTSDDPKDKRNSIYSLDAMLERKIEIVNIRLNE
ncbi:MAG: hypothetical protein QF383_02390 [Flavobacteriales bacterium]|nr:hypothetical protein [Flavobacteriales bacterium]